MSMSRSQLVVGVEGYGLVCKNSLIVFNLIFAGVGLASLVFGLWLNFLNHPRDMFDSASSDNKGGIDLEEFHIAVYVLVVLGTIMLALGIFGEFSACNENKMFLLTFSILLLLLIVAEITVGVLAYTGRDEVGKELGELYVDIYKLYGKNKEATIGSILAFIHSSLLCCGPTEDPPVGKTCTYVDTLESCPAVIETSYNNKAPLVMGVFIGIGAILITQLICSALLSSKIQQDPKDLQ